MYIFVQYETYFKGLLSITKVKVAWNRNFFTINYFILTVFLVCSNFVHFQVIGGKKTESGRLGAFVKKVKKGSVADKKGHLKRGDEVIMWDKTCLQDASYEQVCDAILASKSHRLVSVIYILKCIFCEKLHVY